jgi:hypothetical protein
MIRPDFLLSLLPQIYSRPVEFYDVDADRGAQTNITAKIPVYLIDKLGRRLVLIFGDLAERFPHNWIEADTRSARSDGKTGTNQTIMSHKPPLPCHVNAALSSPPADLLSHDTVHQRSRPGALDTSEPRRRCKRRVGEMDIGEDPSPHRVMRGVQPGAKMACL